MGGSWGWDLFWKKQWKTEDKIKDNTFQGAPYVRLFFWSSYYWNLSHTEWDFSSGIESPSFSSSCRAIMNYNWAKDTHFQKFHRVSKAVITRQPRCALALPLIGPGYLATQKSDQMFPGRRGKCKVRPKGMSRWQCSSPVHFHFKNLCTPILPRYPETWLHFIGKLKVSLVLFVCAKLWSCNLGLGSRSGCLDRPL